jgi:RNA polymerase sigma-70 factor (ECF subfamily)
MSDMNQESHTNEESHPGLGTLLIDRRAGLMAYIERRMGPALRSRIEPDDIFQEVCVEATRARETLETYQGEPFGWLCEIAERRIIDAHRRLFDAKKRSAAREVAIQGARADESHDGLMNLLVASLTTPTQAIARDDRGKRLAEALAALPEEQREALRLRYVEQLPSKEIASRLGKSDGAVRVMLTRALKVMQGLLTDAGMSGRW